MKAERTLCQSFRKEADGSWISLYPVAVETPLVVVEINAGTRFRPGETFLGEDIVARLERECG